MSCEHAHDDGAYVLGALAPADRAAFEGHLAACPPCRGAVAELAALPGLLARLDAPSAERVVRGTDCAERVVRGTDCAEWIVRGMDSAERLAPSPGSAEPSRLARLLRAAARERRRDRVRQRWRTAAAGLAAACLAVLVGVGVALVQRPDGPAPDVPVAMAPMVPAAATSAGPVTAQIGLTGVAGGTRVRMRCTYSGAGYGGEPWTFRLVAYGTSGQAEQVGSWRAGPGEELSVDGMTRFGPDELDRLELQRADGKPLLVYAVA